MKSKLEKSIAQLASLKNQIRIQLNQIRPFRIGPIGPAEIVSKKKIVANKNKSTNVYLPSQDNSLPKKSQRKRQINEESLIYGNLDRSTEKKHFYKHYNDSVSTEMQGKRMRSSYLNIKSERSNSFDNVGYGNSLKGIGEKSNNFDLKRPIIKVFSPVYIENIGRTGRRKTLFY